MLRSYYLYSVCAKHQEQRSKTHEHPAAHIRQDVEHVSILNVTNEEACGEWEYQNRTKIETQIFTKRSIYNVKICTTAADELCPCMHTYIE